MIERWKWPWYYTITTWDNAWPTRVGQHYTLSCGEISAYLLPLTCSKISKNPCLREFMWVSCIFAWRSASYVMEVGSFKASCMEIDIPHWSSSVSHHLGLVLWRCKIRILPCWLWSGSWRVEFLEYTKTTPIHTSSQNKSTHVHS